MQRLKNKKGFTLAELLIVVAIIAVLTAIAVPLFVSSLSKANTAVENANKRAVRVTAIQYLLEAAQDTDNTDVYKTAGNADSMYKGWTVEASVSKSGDIKITSVTGSESPLSTADTVAKDGDNGYTVTVYINYTDVSST